jgi:hypothetical protein
VSGTTACLNCGVAPLAVGVALGATAVPVHSCVACKYWAPIQLTAAESRGLRAALEVNGAEVYPAE